MNSNITLQQLLNATLFQNADYYTTDKGLTNHITAINIMDTLDIDRWLSKGELLVIGNFMKHYFDRPFIDTLNRHKVGAIISKKKFRHCISEDIIELLRYYNIPLILIDNQYAWRDVIIAFQEAEIAQKTQSLAESEHFLKRTIQYFSNNHSLNKLCQVIYDTTGLSMALTNHKLELIDHGNDWPWHEYLDKFSIDNIGRFSTIGHDLNDRPIDGFCYRSLFLTNLDCHLFFIPIYRQHHLTHYIILKTDSQTDYLEPAILSKIENIKSIFLLKEVLEGEFKKNNNYFRGIIFDDLLKIREPDEDLLKKYSLSLGQEIKSDLQVLLVSDILPKDDIIAFDHYFLQLTNHLQTSSLSLNDIHLFARNQHLVMVLGDDAILLKQIDMLVSVLNEFIGHQRYYIGISNVKPYWKLRTAVDEAKQAIRFSKSNLRSENVQFYQDIGILKLLTNDTGNINQLAINELFEQFILPLTKYDATSNTQLYTTLVTFFDNHFSYTETSQMLYIHVNTLRARLAKIESLLSVNLKNTDHLMTIHLALRLHQNKYH